MAPVVVSASSRCAPLAGVILLCLLPALPAFAQRGGLNDARPLQDVMTAYHTAPGTGVLVLNIFGGKPHVRLDRQALLELVNPATKTATWQTTEDASDTAQGVFTDVPFGSYDVEVSAVGYLTVHKQLQVMNLLRPLQLDIVLERDPAAINLDVSDAAMPAKARKETKHAVSALKSGNLPAAQKQLDEAYKLAPASPDLNFLLGYLYFQKKDLAEASTYLGKATTENPNHVQALSLLGRVGLEREDYSAASSALQRAVAADSESWVAHSLLADAYFHQHNYEKARTEAQLAIDEGKNGASSAQLVLGQALAGLGRDTEAIKALNAFLQDSPRNPAAPQVRKMIAAIEKRDSAPAQGDENKPALASLSAVDPLAALPRLGLAVSAWEPPSLDDVKPSVAPGVVCPLDKVIQNSGERVKQLVDDVSRFAAVEDLLHQSLDEMGNPIRTEDRKFNYVVSISEPAPGALSVDEFRAERLDLSGYPDQIASSGFAALALVFHPDMRDSFEMTCEGLGEWRGQAAWLVHFRQRDDRPNRMHSYKVGSVIYPVKLKGRAWITADNFQIVRIEAEMVTPIPEIQLRSEHQIVEYGPVPFPRKNISVWLPKSADIYFDFRHHRYHRRHSFDRYMLFSVDSDEKTKSPAAKPGTG